MVGSKVMAIPNRYSGLVWSSETSALPSSDSTSTPRKPASGNSCKILMAINDRIKSYGPFEPVLWYGATRPPLHRVAIPHLLHGNLRPERPCKNLMGIKRSDQKLRPLRTATLVWSDEPLPHRKAIPHLFQANLRPETPVKI